MKKRVKPILMIVLSLPVLYVLSIGPTVWVWGAFNLRENKRLSNSASFFYKPVIDLQEGDESLAGKALTFYMGLWVEAGETTDEK